MAQVIIPIKGILEKVQISTKRRPIYYHPVYESKIVRSKKGKLAPKRYFVKKNDYRNLDERYCIMFISDNKRVAIPEHDLLVMSLDDIKNYLLVQGKFTARQIKKGKFYLCNKENETRELANPRAAGTPKYETINYQKLYNGNYHPNVRAKIVNELKEYYLPYIKKNAKKIRSFVNRHDLFVVETFIISHIGSANWDIGNRANMYGKTFLDLIVKGEIAGERVTEPLLEDDSVEFVRSEQFTYLETKKEHEKGLMFAIREHDPKRDKRALSAWRRLIHI